MAQQDQRKKNPARVNRSCPLKSAGSKEIEKKDVET